MSPSPAVFFPGAVAAAGAALVVTLAASGAATKPDVALFESGHVRPLAASPDGGRLFAVNTPDNRLEVFRVSPHGLEHAASIPVGLEPVAVAARTDREVWVVNHLSDSISVVAIGASGESGRVVRTLHVGDEPRDIVFAGPNRTRAFVTTAHRGQNTGRDPQLTTPGVGRADVWVFDAAQPGDTRGGTPLTVITLFADTPRALTATPDGSIVYAAAFHSGNQTTVVSELAVPFGAELPPVSNVEGVRQPRVGVIVKWNGRHWLDELGRVWDAYVNFRLPDNDVFAIDATAPVPAAIPGASGVYRGVGTILYNMAVNPVSGKIYVSNTEALNDRRFEGPGTFAGRTVRGHHNENRITILDGASVVPRHLNTHIDYSTCCAAIPNAENAGSLALPMGMAVSGDGRTLYVAAMGSGKVGVFDTRTLEDGTFAAGVDEHIPVSGGGPTGLVLNESRNHLYVLTRFDNSVSVLHTGSKQEIQHVAMFNPEPPSVVAGRRFLYDASFTSSKGDSACATCHVFGDVDSLAWDLGNPDDTTALNANPLTVDLLRFPADPSFLPMKGPLTTQSLRGLANHGPMHWRGDRTASAEAPNAQPDSGAFDEEAAFRKFQLGIVNLLGRHDPLPDDDMQAFADFVLQIAYPPNPIRNLDNSLTLNQALGRSIFFNRVIAAGVSTCEGCHRLDPGANAAAGVRFPGFFGTDGRSSRTGGRPQIIKVPHLRNLYQKVGMFGFPDRINFPFVVTPVAGLSGFLGDQVRGFGFLSAGDFDTIVRFHNVLQFDRSFPFGLNPDGFAHGEAGNFERRLVEAFLLAFDTNHAPIVGQQVTLASGSGLGTHIRINLLLARAAAGECDLVAKAGEGASARGYLYTNAGMFQPDKASGPAASDWVLRLIATLPGQETTYTCVPAGSGRRIGIDRDMDGVLDGDESR